MPLSGAWLPTPTPLDPAEEPPGSLDPLGTLAHAERLAELLLPSFTVRMWRARLLTFAAVASAVADRTVAFTGNSEESRLEARLAFERLFVAAVVRMVRTDSGNYGQAERGLPGHSLAAKALEAGEPLSRANFLRGQAVNGPFGVMARLARDMKLVDDEGRMGARAFELLTAWSDDEQLPGVLDEDRSVSRLGAAWMVDAAKHTAACIGESKWPGGSHRIWETLARRLRPDRIGPNELRILSRLLDAVPARRRVLELLKDRAHLYREASRIENRGRVERVVLLKGVHPGLRDESTDRVLAAAIESIDVYEQMCGLLQQAFDSLVWALKVNGGRARPEVIVGDARLGCHLTETINGLTKAVSNVDRGAERLRAEPSIDPTQIIEPLLRLREDAVAASRSVAALTETVLRRHERVQKDKGKMPWIEQESQWTLVPGDNRVPADGPLTWHDTYLHPFKIANAYSILRDLRQVAVEVDDAEK